MQLGPRERQVADLLLSGADNREIAREMGITESTVKVQLNRMFMRAGITSGSKRVKLAMLLFKERKGNG